MKKSWIKIASLTLIATILDQYSKILVIENIPFSKNYGVAFSIPVPFAILIALTLALLATFIYIAHKEFSLNYWLTQLSLSMVLGGGLANLIDRLNHGYVVDFIALGWWPSFNIADVFITSGILLLIIFYDKIKKV